MRSWWCPRGALRRALARSTNSEPSPLLLELAGPLEALLAGDGIGLEMAARLVTAFLWPRTEAHELGLLLLDDARNVDPATLEACVLAASRGPNTSFGVVARLDATGGLPSVLAALPKIDEIELAPLSRGDAERLAGGVVGEALDAVGRRRWARLGAHVPLGIVEAATYGIVTGDLRWEGDRAAPRSRISGRGKPRGAADWILFRARDESEACRTLLGLVALLGGEAKLSRLAAVLERAGQTMNLEAVLEELIRSRWLIDTQEDWVGLASRTHRDALAGLLESEMTTALRRAATDVIRAEEGVFGSVESAWHAALLGDGPGAASILLAAARATADAHLEASTTQLIAFARRADPSCEEAALELLANALERAPSVLPGRSNSGLPPSSLPAASRADGVHALVPSSPRDAVSVPAHGSIARAAAENATSLEVDTTYDSEPPTIARVGLPPMAIPEILLAAGPAAAEDATAPGATIAGRLGELAKDALLSSDNAALERWVDGLRAAGESPLFTERLRALSRLGRGDIGDALRVLRRTRAALDPADHKLRCQTSLALGVALSVAGRPQEALLEAMDALARARHVNDERGAGACLAFLAKLYAAEGRPEVDLLRAPAP